MARVIADLSGLERVERQAPPPHPSPLKGEGVGGGVGLATSHRSEAAEWIRCHLPLCAEFAAEVRAAFGQTVRMTFASEGGFNVGKPSDRPAFSVSGEALIFKALPLKGKR